MFKKFKRAQSGLKKVFDCKRFNRFNKVPVGKEGYRFIEIKYVKKIKKGSRFLWPRRWRLWYGLVVKLFDRLNVSKSSDWSIIYF